MLNTPITSDVAASLIELALKAISVGAALLAAVTTASELVNAILPEPELVTSASVAVFT